MIHSQPWIANGITNNVFIVLNLEFEYARSYNIFVITANIFVLLVVFQCIERRSKTFNL